MAGNTATKRKYSGHPFNNPGRVMGTGEEVAPIAPEGRKVKRFKATKEENAMGDNDTSGNYVPGGLSEHESMDDEASDANGADERAKGGTKGKGAKRAIKKPKSAKIAVVGGKIERVEYKPANDTTEEKVAVKHPTELSVDGKGGIEGVDGEASGGLEKAPVVE